MTINQKISLQVLSKIAAGMSPIDALKEVCGAENVERMIDDLYNELRARA